MGSSKLTRTSLLALGLASLCIVVSSHEHILKSPSSQLSAVDAVSSGNSEFALALHHVLRKDKPSNNLVYSPFSISAALAMCQAGARGDTATAIRNSLHFPQDQDLHKGFSELLQDIKSDSDVTLQIANKLYPATGFDLEPSFKNILATFYKAEPEQLNFIQKEESAKIINNFVSSSTNDRIKDLVKPDDLSERTKLALVNAIYFKAPWRNQFPKDQTHKASFALPGNKEVIVDMMHLKAGANNSILTGYVQNLDSNVAVLPYKGDKGLSMIVIVPSAQHEDLSVMEEKLKTTTWSQIFGELRDRQIKIYLPRFKLQTGDALNLEKPLLALGAGDIFDVRKADFSGIPEDDTVSLFVSRVLHKAYIEVNEEGSEASGATYIEFTTRIQRPDDPQFRANRPFLAIIARVKTPFTGNASVMPLFISRVINPNIN